LLVDGFSDAYDIAVVLSNDSDLVAPIRAVRTKLKKAVGVINPHQKQSVELKNCASFVKEVRTGHSSSLSFHPCLQTPMVRFTNRPGGKGALA